jgi:hypothetical protein
MYDVIVTLAGTPQTAYGEVLAYIVALVLSARLVMSFVDLFYLIASFFKPDGRR